VRNFLLPAIELGWVNVALRLKQNRDVITLKHREMTMNFSKPLRGWLRTGSVLAISLMTSAAVVAEEHDRSVLVLTSTNESSNSVLVFKLDNVAKPTLSLNATLPTGGAGGAAGGGNGGILQFKDDVGAVANFGSSTVSRLARRDDYITVEGAFKLSAGCTQPGSVDLGHDHVFVAGANCAESHWWPSGASDGVVKLSDASAGQIAVGQTWAAVTLKSGSVWQLPLTRKGALDGTAAPVTLPASANNTPLGAEFWGDNLGFTPAHSPDSFAIVNPNRDIFPIAGPTPAFPTNAPCWVAKGPGNLWYTGNSPGQAISIFFTDDQGGVFYKSVALPGSPTDITVSRDKKWLAVIYTTAGNGYVAVFSIDRFGELTHVATSSPVVASIDGVAISE
jgi:hypothetical protein